VDPIYVYADVNENSLLKFNALADRGRSSNEESAIGTDQSP
jgi:hypothetical protein